MVYFINPFVGLGLASPIEKLAYKEIYYLESVLTGMRVWVLAKVPCMAFPHLSSLYVHDENCVYLWVNLWALWRDIT